MRKRMLLLLTSILFLSSLLAAQGTSKDTGTIRGFVKDNEGNPLPGVNIVASGPAIMGTRSTVTNEEGAFRLPLLPVGVYSLTAELQGFQRIKRENIEVTLAGTITLTIEMMPAKVEEEAVVTAASPLIDVKTSAVAQVYKSDLLLSLPIGRAIGDVVTLAPGVVSSSQVRGGTAANTIYQVDGLYANDPDNAQLGVNVDFNIMEEVNVMTGGMSADVGISSGAFVNVVTKSGGNKFSGLAEFRYTDDSMSKPVLTEDHLRALGLGRPTVALYNYSTSASLGGPIIKDKLWFYANGRYGRSETPSGFVKWTAPTGVTYDEFNRKNWNWGAFLN
ncbi:MAG: carboxypeptidase regulatory-like domain-containing protein [Candidatus Aminicenantales bacterium]